MAAATASGSEQQAAAPEPTAPPAPACPRATLDPQLFMAARRGDSKLLKHLLQLQDEDEDEEDDANNAVRKGGLILDEANNGGVRTNEGDLLLQVVDSGEIEVLDDDHRRSSSHGDDDAPPAAVDEHDEPLDADGVTMEGDSLLHVVAAARGGDDTHKLLDCAKMIVRDKKRRKGGAAAVRLALEARNSKGDTPLHCAAAAGNDRMITCLVEILPSKYNDDGDEATPVKKKELVRMRNECGETALHHAVRAPHNNEACIVIDKLMKHDPDLACVLHKDGTSPLYLAISLGKHKIAEHLYSKSQGKLSYSGPHGRNLTRQRDSEQKGSTPLQLAASLEGWPDARYVYTWFPQIRRVSMSATKALLSVNISTAYQADDQGSYPIHVAAQAGSLAVVKLLLEWCPDCANLRDGQGRTFLHVAAEKERLALVRYVVVSSSADMILNAQDSNGDTPLHAAVRAGNLAVFSCLFRNRQVRLDVANQDGMTPVDLSYTRIPPRFNYSLNPRSSVRRILLAAGAPHGGARPELFYARHIPKRDLDMEAKKHTEATQVMSIVTALIATVTFASAFTFPGGYGPDGQPVLAGSYAFDAFILADTLAFICSISATFSLVYVGFPSMDISIRFRYLRLSAILLQSAARSLVAAFGLGLYLLLVVHHTASAIAACAIVLASSLYGNMEFWGIIHMATTVLARIGMQRYAVVSYARKIFFTVLRHFWSYVIIFGLPAIRKRVNSQVDKVIT
ncbi:hypothetical protein SORBI_3010G004800 [Sorghum bicolor]|uniref:PGG domain-containing protein n=1 Tax=Sorghum bicolor TaxID=4558 RepID=C5Z261_SORBI|nr:hypothetical protein SORBI_3010G004800 [Sorghum bicolor]